MNAKMFLGIAIFLFLIALGGYVFYKIESAGFSVPTSPTQNDDAAHLSSSVIVVKGVKVCLPHKDTSGPQTMECVFGLKSDNGNYYKLHDSDPLYTNISSAPLNALIDVAGTFTSQEDPKYVSIGIIKISKLAQYIIVGPFEWKMTNLGMDKDFHAPKTSVTLTVNGMTYDAGTYLGSCSKVAENRTEKRKTGVLCYFGGGGDEIGVFEENGKLLLKRGDVAEPTIETDAFRGNFTTLAEIK